MLKTKFEFKSDYLMTDEEAKRHEDYLKQHKPKGENISHILFMKYIEKEKRKEVKKVNG